MKGKNRFSASPMRLEGGNFIFPNVSEDCNLGDMVTKPVFISLAKGNREQGRGYDHLGTRFLLASNFG